MIKLIPAIIAGLLCFSCGQSDVENDDRLSSYTEVNGAQVETVGTDTAVDSDDNVIVTEDEENMEASVFYIKAGDTVFVAEYADNTSADALRELLAEGSLTIEMSDYGNFEKVGGIGESLPQNNESITTEPGDIILYQGSSITIYYDTNSWSFTRLGKINDVTRDELLDALGDGDVTVTFSLTAPEGSNGAE